MYIGLLYNYTFYCTYTGYIIKSDEIDKLSFFYLSNVLFNVLNNSLKFLRVSSDNWFIYSGFFCNISEGL